MNTDFLVIHFKSQIKIFDKIALSKHSLSETINSSDFIFVSVPTPAVRW